MVKSCLTSVSCQAENLLKDLPPTSDNSHQQKIESARVPFNEQ